MNKFMKNNKGAVTVFVTLLLIPAMLLSGTAVDLARMHTAKSIVQDANQLAANAVLSQYNALLHDLYGLFGVKTEDPELASMVNEYIEVSIFGEDWNEKGLGTFQLFYGSDLQPADILPEPDKNLRNSDVLRRQIEEYMKYRAPVIIVKELLDALSDNRLKDDKKIIDDKLAIDSDIADLYEAYKRLYDAIVAADKCNQAVGGIAGGHFGSVSTSLTAIHAQFNALLACYENWELSESPEEAGDFDYKTDYRRNYSGILSNIRALTSGGQRGSNWNNGRWESLYTVTGLISNIANAKVQADNFKAKFDSVLAIAKEIDVLHDRLAGKVDSLEGKLSAGSSSGELAKALTEKDSGGKSQIDHYRDVVKWENIADMASVFSDGGYGYIDNSVKPLLDEVKYRNSGSLSAASLTREQLSGITGNSAFALSQLIPASSSLAAVFAGFPEANVTYKIPAGFLKFAAYPGENGEFYDYLKKMMDQPEVDPVKLYEGQASESGGDSGTNQRNMISSLLELVENTYSGLTNEPLGAKYIKGSGTSAREKLGIIKITQLIMDALSDNVADVISSPVQSLAKAGDYMLLLTYCASMFSNYATARPQSNGKAPDSMSGISFPKSLAGIPMSPDVNYFFQSELEYLYHGSDSAGDNLNAVMKLIFLVRLVCNYISVFRVSEVTAVVNSIRTAFAWCPPLGLTLAELARAAFVAAESIVDVASLRSGYKVPLLKSPEKGDWNCRPSGLATLLARVAAGDAAAPENDKGLTYSNYLVFFFIVKAVFTAGAAAELANRAANLIEWNVINYESGIKADESRMAGALGSEGAFKLSDMDTDFRLNTTVSMRMLFLSMPLAQRGIDSVIPPKGISLTASDYRGY